jgi:general secretion pathway protein G
MRRRRAHSGFTLIELLVVMAILSILATIAIPQMVKAPIRAKEAVLAEDLFTFRQCIDQYYADKGHYPASLEVLKQEKYLRKVPVDPFTKSAETWIPVLEELDTASDTPSTEPPGVVDVHSGSEGIALDGTPYNTW